jgi:vacuolar protein-sorting-associated protein 4
LLYGPPGTGKSFLARACASECEGATFITASPTFLASERDLKPNWPGKLIESLFNAARQETRAIIFIDEIDLLLSGQSARDSRIKRQLLIEMDRMGNSIDEIVLLATTS